MCKKIQNKKSVLETWSGTTSRILWRSRNEIAIEVSKEENTSDSMEMNDIIKECSFWRHEILLHTDHKDKIGGNINKNFRSRRWGSSLPGLRTRDPPLSPLSTWAKIFRHLCLQSHLQTSPQTHQKSYPKFQNSTKSLYRIYLKLADFPVNIWLKKIKFRL